MKKIILLFITLFIINCVHNDPSTNNQFVENCKPQVIYKEIKVPIYLNPLKDLNVEKPNELYNFEFSENGQICLSDNDFKSLIKNLTILNNDRFYYYNIINTLKNDNRTEDNNTK